MARGINEFFFIISVFSSSSLQETARLWRMSLSGMRYYIGSYRTERREEQTS